MAFGGGGNGQWVRTRTQAGAKSFLDEMEMGRRRRAEAHRRARQFGGRIAARLRRLFRRP